MSDLTLPPQKIAKLARAAFPLVLPFSWSLKFRIFTYGILVPCTCIAFSIFGSMGFPLDPWQSGEIQDFAKLHVMWPTVGSFLPVLFYSVTCLTIWIFRPKFGNNPWTRLGIYSGVILSLHFVVVYFQFADFVEFLAAAYVLPIFGFCMFLIYYFAKRIKRFTIMHLMLSTALVALAITFIPQFIEVNGIGELLELVTLATIAAGPVLTLTAFLRASIAVRRQTIESRPSSERKIRFRTQITGILVWLIAYVVSWKLAVELMMIEYQKLPTTNPTCYVCSAAAHGHRRIVGSTNAPTPINSQMQRLKFLEFVFAAISPKTVRMLRRSYDRYGPIMARYCRANVWFADLTYMTLKPIEIAAIAARFILRIDVKLIQKVYRK